MMKLLKRGAAALLAAVMLCGSVPALAAETAEAAEPKPDPAGTVTWENLLTRVEENSLDVKALSEAIAAVESIDYDKIGKTMREGIGQISDVQWMLVSLGQSSSSTYSALQSQYASLKDSYDDLMDGTRQRNDQDTLLQLESTKNQLLQYSQTMYIAILSMEQSKSDLEVQSAALDRQVKELELRYKVGQVSALTLQQAKNGQASLASGKKTLEMNLTNYKQLLENSLGVSAKGTITLGALPEVTAEELAAMDHDKDFAAAKAASWTVRSAQSTRDDAEKDWKDAAKDYGFGYDPDKKYLYDIAKHTWEAAQVTYDSAMQSFSTSFDKVFRSVEDAKQVLDNANTALDYAQKQYAAAQIKYSCGTISKNALLTAQDDVATARSTVQSAQSDLLSAYNNYRWAVQYGLVS